MAKIAANKKPQCNKPDKSEKGVRAAESKQGSQNNKNKKPTTAKKIPEQSKDEEKKGNDIEDSSIDVDAVSVDKISNSWTADLTWNIKTADQKVWGMKIKNCLQWIVKDAQSFINEMGQTGIGIMKKSDLDMLLNNHITNYWRSRPEIDSISLSPEPLDSMAMNVTEEKHEIGWLVAADDDNSDDDDDELPAAITIPSKKWKYEDSSSGDVDEKKPDLKVADNNKKKIKGPCVGKSTPANTSTAVTQKPKLPHEAKQFANLATCKEEITQKAIDLKKTKVLNAHKKSVTKVKAQADIKMNKDNLYAQLAVQKLELEYQFKLQMAQMGSGLASGPAAGGGFEGGNGCTNLMDKLNDFSQFEFEHFTDT
ncbi:hypothetical protein HYPSUDRAFT_53263 [Hypholoma sublateritium FD-334 SS-4]|uniref:No apical meristem-associated C-terminal domain-containing protein n=1 Tax=Hypholoma sublateritium (strain FD-334 SS-4) TaxID=945553 RepID=A0A0D2LDB8_HYPSF|nr:hypothetical protein HYPSUDRAFT_53263 [Hypholoma sublateritium FD-334 SS-4]